jgi:hypothetical protein
MKTIVKLITTSVFVILIASTTVSYSQAGKTNFSGTWALNESKSTPAEGGFRMVLQMVITQDGNNLSYESTRKNMDGEDVKTTSKFTLDGKECSNPAGFQNSTRKSIVTWSADGKALGYAHTSNFEMNGETREFKSSESWKLTDDKTLSVEVTMNFQGEERKTTNVYDKK